MYAGHVADSLPESGGSLSPGLPVTTAAFGQSATCAQRGVYSF
jgi:hypothetical protein